MRNFFSTGRFRATSVSPPFDPFSVHHQQLARYSVNHGLCASGAIHPSLVMSVLSVECWQPSCVSPRATALDFASLCTVLHRRARVLPVYVHVFVLISSRAAYPLALSLRDQAGLRLGSARRGRHVVRWPVRCEALHTPAYEYPRSASGGERLDRIQGCDLALPLRADEEHVLAVLVPVNVIGVQRAERSCDSTSRLAPWLGSV